MFGSESYPLEAFQSWIQVADKPWVLGDFVWTAFDYIGEASIGWRGYYQKSDFYPWNLAFCGDIDICGWKRPQSFYRDALWKKDQLSLFVKPPHPSFPLNPDKESWSKWEWHDVVKDWNWDGNENNPLEVHVYSSCEKVELFLNGKSLGTKKTDRSAEYKATFHVPYQKGILKAVGYNGKKKVATTEIRTAEDPKQLTLVSDRKTIKADGQDLGYITVELKDNNGNIYPKGESLVKFTVDGPGTIVGVGNANPVSLESYQLPQRKLWHGKALVIIKAGSQPGDITLTANTDGFPPATIVITSGKDK
jgi:beta-galactosidase